jgi:hypothetical protein
MSHRFLPIPEPRYNLLIKQGATFRVAMTWKDADGVVVPLAGLDAWLHIRSTIDSSDILFSLTTGEDERILLADTAPNITLYISDEDTSGITEWNKGEQDILIEMSNGDRRRLWKGIATVSPGSTRDVP